MRCPHCTVEIFPSSQWSRAVSDGTDEPADKMVVNDVCPSCGRWFIELQSGYDIPVAGEIDWVITARTVLWPRTSSRPPIPAEVPDPLRSVAVEAGLILADSPRASAALSRRCLQQVLREESKAPPSDLFHEIEWAIANAGLPSHAKEGLHDLREIGNMAAHPNMSTATGEYLEVEPGEAEWTLDVLDALFDHYFVGPARTAARRAALDAKLGKTR